MSAYLHTFLLWLGSFLEDENGVTSSKRLLFVCSGFTFLGICVGLAIAISGDKTSATSALITLIWAVSGMATGGYLGGKAVERKKDTANDESRRV